MGVEEEKQEFKDIVDGSERFMSEIKDTEIDNCKSIRNSEDKRYTLYHVNKKVYFFYDEIEKYKFNLTKGTRKKVSILFEKFLLDKQLDIGGD